jgi:hypothetical protein
MIAEAHQDDRRFPDPAEDSTHTDFCLYLYLCLCL